MSQELDRLGIIRRSMGTRRMVGRLVDGARRAVGMGMRREPDVTPRLETVVEVIAERIGQPPVLVVKSPEILHGEPLYCSVCRVPRSMGGKRMAPPRFTQGFRCGFLLVLCDRCWRRIRKSGTLIDTVVETHRVWHGLLSMSLHISELWEKGARSTGDGGMVN